MFVTNTANHKMTAIGWKTKRLGNIAYDNHGKWLVVDCDHYCPEHAMEAAQELELEYSSS